MLLSRHHPVRLLSVETRERRNMVKPSHGDDSLLFPRRWRRASIAPFRRCIRRISIIKSIEIWHRRPSCFFIALLVFLLLRLIMSVCGCTASAHQRTDTSLHFSRILMTCSQGAGREFAVLLLTMNWEHILLLTSSLRGFEGLRCPWTLCNVDVSWKRTESSTSSNSW